MPRFFANYKLVMAHHQANHLVMVLQCNERGHCAAIQNNSVAETFIPTDVQDTLAAHRVLDPAITVYMKEKLEEEQFKLYVNIQYVFPKTKKGGCHRCTD